MDIEGKSGLDAAQILEILRKEPELIPDEHDGSYELMRQTIEAYSELENYEIIDYTDLDLIYLMAVITTRDGVEKKKNRVQENQHLNEVQKKRIIDTIDRVWEKAVNKEYSNDQVPSDTTNNLPFFGMFGTGFRTFKKVDSDGNLNWKKQIRNLIRAFVDIKDMNNDDQIFDRVQEVIKYPIKGLQAGSVSIMLHCLKPYTFPIINGNEKMGDLFSELGISLKQKHLSETYIQNCKNIKHFRDTYLTFKNYRVFDLVARRLNSKIELYPPLDRYANVLSKEQWIEFLTEDKKTHPNTFIMLKTMLEMGDEASPLQLAEKLKTDSPAPFISRGSSLGVRVKKKYNIPDYYEVNGAKYDFIVPFRGHPINTEDGKGLYSWVLRPELKAALIEFLSKEDDESMETDSKMIFDHNIILYGPPGTGKTYNTVVYAVAIIEKKDIEDIRQEAIDDYKSVKRRFDEYKEAGRVAFTTFHQSYGYEEFIEGIKPCMSDEDDESKIEYHLETGVFKGFCESACTSSESEKSYGLNKSPVVWKVSLAKTYDNPVREECLKNGHIRIGWDSYGPEVTDEVDYKYGGKSVLNAFINKMRIGDIVLSCYTSATIDAIGVITGDCEWDDSYSKYKRVRKVNWIVKGINEDIVELNGGSTMTLSTVYQMRITVGDVIDFINKVKAGDTEVRNVPNNDNYVFIIDEINRGNISKIFGELITLIEDTKRIGAKEEMRVKLPYSPNEKPFGVPQNVYIIGTMNTADRSIALMDTALRRRFSFVEMLPDSKVLRKIGADKVESEGLVLDVADMLDIINGRIEYLFDREHTIGHAFFTGLKNNPTIERLAAIFEKSVIPLLQEYFYEDYSKIQLVLGDDGKKDDDKQYQFIRETEIKPNDLFNTVPEIEVQNKYEIQRSAFLKIKSYKMIGKGL